MSKYQMFVWGLVLAVVVAFAGLPAFAAEQKAEEKAAPAAGTAQCAKAPMKAEVTGKVVEKAEMKDGKEVKSYSLEVAECKCSDAKCAADMKGKSLALTGSKLADVEKLAGKEVTASGEVKDGKTLDVHTIAEKAAPAAAAAPAPAPAAAPAGSAK